MAPAPIRMIDNESQEDIDELLRDDCVNGQNTHLSSDFTTDGLGGTNRGIRKLWCKRVVVGEYVIISGNNGAKYIVWTITVETLKNSKIVTRKRYKEFEELHRYLVEKYPQRVIEIANLPPKSVFQNYDSRFLEKRRHGLEFFLNSVLLNPVFSVDENVKKFITT
ncbi:hypothetical protein PACTADRAFT_51538 [Pachysolen tannophilus NRRL Y-2460]|uniref:Endosomal/vacuolar adapter protein YPT35 n=1 Tax=Pachysolen tannophilus NRRL Y-2460 TaxID=669874 RepID=A0A1E4TPZ6_PACTA|nr:hypothetical protein PACTADRAFT_51538 [Pachysolen tannophilus NRRL Y-2460]